MKTTLSYKTIKKYIKSKKIGDNICFFLVCPCCKNILSSNDQYITGFHTKEDAIIVLEKFMINKAKDHLDYSFYQD